MRHRFLRGLRPARNGIVFQVDARRDHKAIVRQLLAVGENNLFFVAIDLGGQAVDDGDAMLFQPVITVRDRRIVSDAAEIEIAVEASLIPRVRLDQSDGDSAGAVLGDVFRGSRAARAAADHHHARLGLSENRGRTEHHRTCKRRRPNK